MRITIFGAGAIGGYLAARLAAVEGVALSVVARGAHLAAIRDHGLRLVEPGGHRAVPVPATDTPAALGPQDCVILTVKAHSVAGALPAVAPLLGPGTAVVTMQNGIPWWYFHRSGGPHEGRRIAAVDPGGAISAALGPERAIGAVVYVAAEVVAPGVIEHPFGDRLVLGEPSGAATPRLAALAGVLAAAGIDTETAADIRTAIWVKLWGNLAFNPVSALTGATLAGICGDDDGRAVARAMMVEAAGVAEALGIRLPLDVDARIARAAAVGAHRTSMLQDLERGRPMEIDPIVTAVQELGRLAGRPTPGIDLVLNLLRCLARSRGCYAGGGTRP